MKKKINWKLVGGVALAIAAAGVATYVINKKYKNAKNTKEK